jgi:hypothetical protein
MASSGDLRRFVCSTCPKRYSKKWQCTRHEKGHAPATISCDSCSALFKDNKELKRHAVRHLPIEEQPLVTCPACDQTLSRADSISRHLLTCSAVPRPHEVNVLLKSRSTPLPVSAFASSTDKLINLDLRLTKTALLSEPKIRLKREPGPRPVSSPHNWTEIARVVLSEGAIVFVIVCSMFSVERSVR